MPNNPEGGFQYESTELDNIKLIECYKRESLEITKLDPLSLDLFFTERLHQLNETKDIAALQNVLDSISIDHIETSLDAMAALRDIGMIVASLRRVSQESISEKTQLQLVQLAEIADEVPRDTVYSYGPRNRPGEQKRTFTALPAETAFIESFTEGIEGLNQTLIDLYSYDNSPEVQLLQHAAQGIEVMKEAIIKVRRVVTPDIFTNQLRPFFEPYMVNGRSYSAAGGAQMPLILIDQYIWGSDTNVSQYSEFSIDNRSYLPAALRKIYDGRVGKKSLVNFLLEEHHPELASATIKLLKSLISFRQPHRKVAEENFKLRPQGSVGSGGYDTSILTSILDQNKHALLALQSKYGEAI